MLLNFGILLPISFDIRIGLSTFGLQISLSSIFIPNYWFYGNHSYKTYQEKEINTLLLRV